MAKVRKRSKWDRAHDRHRHRPRTPAVKQKLDAFAEGDLEAWLRTGPLPPLARAALGIPL